MFVKQVKIAKPALWTVAIAFPSVGIKSVHQLKPAIPVPTIAVSALQSAATISVNREKLASIVLRIVESVQVAVIATAWNRKTVLIVRKIVKTPNVLTVVEIISVPGMNLALIVRLIAVNVLNAVMEFVLSVNPASVAVKIVEPVLPFVATTPVLQVKIASTAPWIAETVPQSAEMASVKTQKVARTAWLIAASVLTAATTPAPVTNHA
jgi:hypothetical protein